MTFSFAPISLGHTKPQDELDEALVGGQKKLDQDKDGDIDAKDFAMLRGKKKKKKNEDEPEGENGETASMNPKMATAKEGAVKEYGMVYANKHKKGKMKADEGHMDKKKHPSYYENQKNESVGKTPGDDSYHNLQKAKRMAAADGHDYDKLPAYDRTSNKHKDYYDNKAKNEGVNENNPAHYAAIAAADKRHRERMGVKPVPNMNDPKFKMTKKDKMTKDPMNPTGAMTGYRSKIKDHVEKDGNMSIREKLISVVERANHGNMDSQETYDDMYKGAGAKKMRKDHQNMKVDTTRKLGVDDASKAGKATKKAPMRRADNAKGDTNIVPAGTPMKDPSASKDTALENVIAAYESMHQEGSIKGSGTDRKAELKRAFRSGEHQTDLFYGDRGRTPKRAIKIPKGMRGRGQYTSKHSDKSIERAFNTGKHADQSLVPPKGKERQKPQDELKGAKSRRDVELRMRRGQPVNVYAVKKD